MNTRHHTQRLHARAGISLLEVLISIGILSIGLLATLSLIPAGRTYMKKASVDDRAAALVPNAYATMTRLGLMKQTALSWTDVHDPLGDFSDPENSRVIRDARGGDIFNYSSRGHTYNAFSPESSAPWVITATTSIDSVFYHGQPVYQIGGSGPRLTGSPARVSGSVPSHTPGFAVAISTATTGYSGTTAPSAGPSGSTTAMTSGTWSYAVTPQPLSVPQMMIIMSGAGFGTPTTPESGYSIVYTPSATYLDTTATPPASTPTPVTPSSWKQFGRLRSSDIRRGRARITYSRPSYATDVNNAPNSALLVPMTRLENAAAQGQGTIARSVWKTISGRLWRLQAGTREGYFTRNLYFDTDGITVTSQDPAMFPDKDITENAGDTWVTGPVNQEDVDWYKFRVDAGDMLQISWNDPNGVLLANSGYKFPVYLNTTNVSGSPMPSITAFNTATSRTYTIPNDGYVITRAQLLPYNLVNPDADIPGLVNTFGRADYVKGDRENPAYDFTVRFSRTDRVVVVDPLMASRFDKVLSLSGPVGDFDPRYLKRHRFADFQQTYAQTGSPRAFVIPRLNWQTYSSGFVDTMVAVSEKLFHDQDNIAVDLPTNSEDPPTQIFDLASTNSPGRRQAEGRMSWLLMVQPEDPGPVATNWPIAGRYFDVSLVIFENRKLPPLVASPALDGEYAFNSTWSDLDGMINVTVPGTLGLDEDDVRDLFKTGAWILLAPQVNYDDSPLDSTQRLDWIRIQTAQVEPGANGVVTAKILPESEPADNILYRTSYPLNTTSFPIVVLAYQGVVAVVNKSVQLAP